MAISPESADTPRACTKYRPRWFQFRLRTLLLLLTAVAALLTAWRIYVEPYRRQRQTVELIKDLGGRVGTAEAPGWLRQLFGEGFQNVLLVDVADHDEPEEYLGAVAALPVLETLVVGGPRFGDEQLQRLRDLRTLRGLVLDSTDVTPSGLAKLRQALPLLEVYRSPRRAMAEIRKAGGTVHGRIRLRLLNYAELALLVGAEYLDEADFCVMLQWASDADSVLLRYFVNLRELALCSGQITDVALVNIARLTQLRDLQLDGTQITDAGLVNLKGMSHLQRLYLANTSITAAGLAHLKGFKNLEHLVLSGSPIGDAGLEQLKGLANLRTLKLDKTLISDSGLVHLKDMTHLRELVLTDTPITDFGLEHLKGLTSLCFLHLDGTRITDAGLVQLKGLTNVSALCLDRTQITGAGLRHLKGLKELVTLCLVNTRIHDEGIQNLKEVASLTTVNLHGTNVTPQGIADLRKALPQCEVRH